MSDFLHGALDAAKADVASRRAGKSTQRVPEKKHLSQSQKRKDMTWLSNPGAKDRAKADTVSSSGLSDYDLERSRKALEKKQRKYNEMFNKGTDMALTGQAADDMLVDFDRKWAEGHRREGDIEQDFLPNDEEDDDNSMIEIQDEFGRARYIRKCDALVHERPIVENQQPEGLIRGPHLQHFNPDVAKKDAIWLEENESKEVHYNPDFEVRQRGTGYINLGRGTARKERMSSLNDLRQKTEATRSDTNVRPQMNTASVDSETKEPRLVADPANNEPEHIHPSRKHHLEAVEKAFASRDEKRYKVGADFLDNLF